MQWDTKGKQVQNKCTKWHKKYFLKKIQKKNIK